jgi:pimeloyl-ACP methyl ester carboxylesterase
MPHFTAPDGTTLAYDDRGQGLPLLCLPGLTRTMADFEYLMPHLPPLRLIRMDCRGRGDSQWTGPATYNVPQEGADALALMDHLGVTRFAILGTSRGGLIGMYLAAVAHDRLLGLGLNDVGPVIERAGLTRIFDYLGRNPAAKTHAALAAAMPGFNPGFDGVPETRWRQEAQKHYRQTERGLQITYDPALKEAFLAAMQGPLPDLWPLFDACAGLPLALIRGANSDLLSMDTATEMQRRRPDMLFANVPGRAHIPFLDEEGSLAVIAEWLKKISPR